jgi:hypothetical protein
MQWLNIHQQNCIQLFDYCFPLLKEIRESGDPSHIGGYPATPQTVRPRQPRGELNPSQGH